jgi:signal transduction histidine kinase/ligand-binding sensor domain-containing protein
VTNSAASDVRHAPRRLSPRAIFCLAALACPALPGLAQYRIEAWTPDNGLPIGSVNNTLQTRDGYLWLSTFAGLVRYDGASFQVFNPVNSKGLRTSRFTGLFEDREGALWARTEGQGLTRYFGGVFHTYTAADGLPDNSVGMMFYDPQGHLLIDSGRGPVEWRNGRFVDSHHGYPSESDHPGLFLGRTQKGQTWYGDASGLHLFEHDGVIETIPLHLDFKRVYRDRSGSIWIEYGNPDGSRTMAVYRDGKLTNFSERDGVPPFRTFGAFEDRNGDLWFGLQLHGGLLRLHDGKFTRYTTADGLPSNNVGQLYEDREGTLWAPTDGGLAWFTRQAVSSFGPAEGLAAENVYPILQDHAGAIWVGTWPGLTRYERGVFTNAGKAFGVDDKNIMALYEDPAGALWIGTWGYGIIRCQAGKAQSFADSQAPGLIVRAIIQDRAGVVWAGGPNGLFRFQNGSFVRVGSQEGFPGQHAFSLFVDRSGSLWVGSDVGVSRYRDGRFTNFGEAQGFAGQVVRSIYEDSRGVLWLGTYDTGLFRYADGRFTRYTANQGLLDNGAFQILEDGQENLWLSCNVGIYRVRKRELEDVAAGKARTVTSVTYGKRDGMRSAECNGGGQPAGIRTADGRMWFPTQKGVAVVNPGFIPLNGQPPPVVIESVVIDQQPVAGAGQVEIRPGQANLEIHYSALTFLRPELAQFKYRLENLDKDWVVAGNRRTAYYSHLPSGSYRFHVIAANRDGVWNEAGAGIPVVSVSPYWRTWWFDILTAGTAAALAVFLYRRRIALIRREQAAQIDFARRLIDSQEKERKRISAELHDSLSQTLSIIKNRAVLTMQNGSAVTALDQMEEIASAAAEGLAEVREIVHDLRPVEIDRLGLTKALRAQISKVATSSGIELTAHVDPLDGTFSASAEMNLYRIVQEGLSNIVKHSGASEASVRVRRDHHAVEITIRDNGKGFAHDGPVASDAPRGGLGLMGMTERARIIGAKLQIVTAPGSGTILTLRIPFDGAAHAD